MVLCFFYLRAGTSARVHSQSHRCFPLSHMRGLYTMSICQAACLTLPLAALPLALEHEHAFFFFFYPIAQPVEAGKHSRSMQLWNEDATMTLFLSLCFFK